MPNDPQSHVVPDTTRESRLTTELCRRFGIEHPIFGFAHDIATVAAITKNAEGVPIVVVRHADNLLTVYANVTDVSVKKGDKVSRGQSIAKLRSGDDAYVHFEVRKGFDSVDPEPFING